jgi:anti-anti-sigma factor
MDTQLLPPCPAREGPVEEAIVVHFTGAAVSLDEDTNEQARDQLLALAEEATRSPLLLDFRNVTYLSSSALGALIALHRSLLSKGRRLTIHNLRPPAYEVFRVTRLDELLDLQPADRTDERSEPSRSVGVLVTDDNHAVRSTLTAILRREGFAVWEATNGGQALELYRRHADALDVVLLDVLMPELDGPGTLLALQNLCPHVRCCFITGGSGPYTEEALLRRGAVRVFWKPFSFVDLIDAVQQLGSQAARRRRDHWIELGSLTPHRERRSR